MTEIAKTSIITPCYNGSQFLSETIDSVLKQTLSPHEMIIIDDGSTDDSAAIADSYGPPVRVIRQENQGESVARNRGIEEAKGSHILFLDADDLLHPQALERLSELVGGNENQVGLMGCGFFREDPSDQFQKEVPLDSKFFPDIFSRNLGAVHAWLTPTKLIREVGGFNESMQYFEDWEFWGRIGLAGGELVTTDFVGCYYRRFAGSQTRNAPKMERSLGHADVVNNLISLMLSNRQDLIAECSESAFWCGWTALHRSLKRGASWEQVHPLAQTLEKLVRNGSDSLRKSSFSRMIRVLGFKNAYKLRSTFQKEQAVSS